MNTTTPTEAHLDLVESVRYFTFHDRAAIDRDMQEGAK